MEAIGEYCFRLPRQGKMRVDATVFASPRVALEREALNQLIDAASLPSVVKVVATPDIHVGFGIPIGCVIGARDIVVPAAVGYDVNCGMRLLATPLQRDQVDLEKLANSIRRDIPLGEGKTNLSLSEDALRLVLDGGLSALDRVAGGAGRVWECREPEEERDDLLRVEENGSLQGDSRKLSATAITRGRNQLGTLGGGNHFIEIEVVDLVEDEPAARAMGLRRDQIVVMIHSGSRGLGHQVGGDYMRLAKEAHGGNESLCYLDADSSEGQNYVKAMNAAANFAFVNRQVMAMLVRRNFRHSHPGISMPTVYDVPHNIAKLEEHGGEPLWVHRKGATRAFPPGRMAGTPFARIGQPVLIPGSMGAASYILLCGPRAAEALFSVNHGAGRAMSRTAAAGVSRKGKVKVQARISDEEFRESMKGIVLIAEDKRTIKEEAPAAYKDIGAVIEAVVGAGLAAVVARMKPLAVLKG